MLNRRTIISGLLCSACSFPAAAQEVQEIIVTATKRPEAIQDIPLAVSAFSGSQLAARGVVDVHGLMQISPSVNVVNTNNNTNGGSIQIRGVGTRGNNPGLEPSVGVFVDGVYIPRSGQALTDLLDVERIEVLRGPQGTLFGKNTSAGAISIVTERPRFETSGSASASFGNYDHRRFAASLTGPLAEDKVAFRLAAALTKRDGHLDDLRLGGANNDRDRVQLKGQLLWRVGPDLDLRLVAEHAESDERCCSAVFRIVGPAGAVMSGLGGTVPASYQERRRETANNFRPRERLDEDAVYGEANWDAGWAKVTALASWRRFDAFRSTDLDFSDTRILRPQDADERFENTSLEVRAVGDAGPVSWLAGFYGFHEKMYTDSDVRYDAQAGQFLSRRITGTDVLAATIAPNGAGESAYFIQKSRGWSLFTHNTWHVSDRVDLTVGLRYTDESKRAIGIINGAQPGTVIDEPFCAAGGFIELLCSNRSFAGRRGDQVWTGTVNASFRPVDGVLTYVSYSRGYKAGGFNLDAEAFGTRNAAGVFVDATKFDPETADAWEAGLKGTFLDGRLIANVAVFYNVFNDFQLNTFNGVGFSITNESEVVSKGAEVETSLRVAEGVNLSLGATYADTYFNETVSAALQGGRLQYSPLWQGSASVRIARPLPGTALTWFTNLNLTYRGDYFTDTALNPALKQEAFVLANLQAGIRTTGGGLEVSVWSNNLTDRFYRTHGFACPLQTGSFCTFVGDPRTYGVTLTTRF